MIRKSQTQATLYTVLSLILIALILIFGTMRAVQQQQDEGVMVSFGDNSEGFGQQVEQPQAAAQPAEPEQQTAAPKENLLTQQDPSVVLDQERKRAKEQQDKQLKQQQEAERKAAAERAAKAAEQQQQAQNAHNMANGAFNKAFGQGSGTSTGDTQQGNPAGHGSSGGHSWSLNGRDILGTLAEPAYHGNQEGVVVVDIRVDANGNVTNATIGKGTTVSSESLRNESIAAAKRNKFSTGSSAALGTITYRFILK